MYDINYDDGDDFLKAFQQSDCTDNQEYENAYSYYRESVHALNAMNESYGEIY